MQATYFDGRTARAHAVQLSIEDGTLVIAGDGLDVRHTMGSVVLGDSPGSTPRVFRFVDGASCEVPDGLALTAFLAGHGIATSRVTLWERSWRKAIAALAVVMVAGVIGYVYGLPALARSAADNLPPSALDSLSHQMQRVLDWQFFSPTKLPEERRAGLLKLFDGLVLPGDTKARLQLNFRSAESIGANALALPSGAVFITDELVELTKDDRVLVAVLTHEAGHVEKRHGLRQVIQGSVVGALVTWYLGDVSALGAAAPTALLNAKYSRDLEREADAYAANVLRANGLPPSLLADALELIEKAHGGKGAGGAASYLSSHPATEERLTWIRGQ